MTEFDRRQLLSAAAATLTAARAGGGGAAAQSSLPVSFRIGAIEVTVLSDGHMVVPALQQAVGEDPANVTKALALAGQTGDRIEPATNITLIRTGANVVLVDTGAGPHFMPTTGKLLDNMKAARIDPRSITHVVFTHAHPDHIWGTLDDFDEQPVFANAAYVIGEDELAFWLSPDAESRLPEDRRNFAAGARRNLGRIKERLKTVQPGAEFLPGLTAIDTAGHTAGHLSVLLASGTESMMVLGDALIHPVISFQHPEWRPAGDHHDPARAVATRRRLLDRLATDRTRIIGYHLPAPGHGRAERRGTAFVFVPGA